MSLESLFELVTGEALGALILGITVFAGVSLGRKVGLIKDGQFARIGNVVGVFLLGGWEVGDVEAGIASIMAALAAAFSHEITEWLGKKRGS